MKKTLCILFAFVFCLMMAFPAFAAVDIADDIEQKPTPGFKAVDGDGNVAVVYDAEGNEMLRISAKDLVATAFADLAASNLSDESKNMLQNSLSKFQNPDAFLSIQAADMNEVALDALGIHNTADSFGVWHMFDLSNYNDEVAKLLEQGAYLQTTFDLGDAAGEIVAAMVYANEKWNNVEIVNNGDGTITCKFGCFGTVTFLAPFGVGGGNQESQDGPGQNPEDPNEDEDFVPSVGYKPLPGLAPDEDGNIGGIVDPNGNVDPVEPECFSFISVGETEKPHGTLSEQERVLRSVFNVMSNPNVRLSKVAPAMNAVAEQMLGVGYTADDLVIRDLFYMDFVCPDHATALPTEGTVLELAFELGLAPDDLIAGMVFVEGEWIPVEAINNGDDTATFKFTDLCPVAFLVPKEQKTAASAGVFASSFFVPQVNEAPVANVAVEAPQNNSIWMLTGSVSLIAAVALLGVLIRGKKREQA